MKLILKIADLVLAVLVRLTQPRPPRHDGKSAHRPLWHFDPVNEGPPRRLAS